MKTESLSWAEAIRAYANGECVRDRRGTDYWLNGEIPNSISQDGFFDRCTPSFGDEPFSIVVPQPKRLTFNEAMEQLKDGKDVTFCYAPKRNYVIDHNAFPMELAILDLAERKGWPITGTAYEVEARGPE